MSNFFRPFELLKLIRDDEIASTDDFMRRFLRASTRGYKEASRFFNGLKRVDLLKITENKPTVTPRLKDLLEAMNLSLRQLSPYSEDSVICTPAFGRPSKPPVASDIFVLMPFANEFQPVYDDHIKASAEKLGRTVARADDFFTAAPIISDIWNALNACRIVVADCTGKNPNVFYEIGVAHTLGKPVVLIAQSTSDIPFDIRHIRTIIYDFTPRGMREFEDRLVSTLSAEVSRPQSLKEYLAEMGE